MALNEKRSIIKERLLKFLTAAKERKDMTGKDMVLDLLVESVNKEEYDDFSQFVAHVEKSQFLPASFKNFVKKEWGNPSPVPRRRGGTVTRKIRRDRTDIKCLGLSGNGGSNDGEEQRKKEPKVLGKRKRDGVNPEVTPKRRKFIKNTTPPDQNTQGSQGSQSIFDKLLPSPRKSHFTKDTGDKFVEGLIGRWNLEEMFSMWWASASMDKIIDLLNSDIAQLPAFGNFLLSPLFLPEESTLLVKLDKKKSPLEMIFESANLSVLEVALKIVARQSVDAIKKFIESIDNSLLEEVFSSALRVGNQTVCEVLINRFSLGRHLVNMNDIHGETQLKIIQIILPKLNENPNFNANAQNSDGKTLMHRALECNNLGVVEYMLKAYKAKMDIPDNNGVTAQELVSKNPKAVLIILSAYQNLVM